MKVQQSIAFDEELLKPLKDRSFLLDRSQSWIVNEALKEYLEKNKKVKQ